MYEDHSTSIPNQETLEAFKETDQGLNLIPCENVDDLFGKLELQSSDSDLF